MLFFFHAGLEGRAVQSNAPGERCDRERPSARRRASQVLSGAPNSTNPNLMPIGEGAYFVDENLTAKFEKDFEAPDKNEIDFFAEKL